MEEKAPTSFLQGYGGVVLLVLLAVITLLAWRRIVGGSSIRTAGDSVVIAGQCGAGKTALFHYIRSGVVPHTVSSLKSNVGSISLKQGTTISTIPVIDFPGHARLNHDFHRTLCRANCIVYVIDSANKASLKHVAAQLYEIFTLPQLLNASLPIMLACNKSDLVAARRPETVRDDIEREVERLRRSRAATLEGQHEADSYLGVEGESFSLDAAPWNIEMCRLSVKDGNVADVLGFITRQYSNNTSQ